MEYIIGVGFISTFGYDLLLKTMSKTTDNIYYLITHIQTNMSCSELTELDLDVQIKMIQNTIDYVHTCVTPEKQLLLEPIMVSMKKNLDVIEYELKCIQDTLTYNQKLWVPYLFAKNLDPHIRKILSENKILSNRFDMFLKIFQIQK